MKLIAIVGLSAWLVGVAFGVREIAAYSITPGDRAEAPATWPAGSTLSRAHDQATVVMFVHPECPCSRASLAELAEIAAAHRAAFRIVLAGAGDAWDAAGRVRGAERILDPLEREAERFGARTSGHVVVYDVAGTLRYSGGITSARGHHGDNVGRRKVEAIVAGDGERDTTHPVFGCPL